MLRYKINLDTYGCTSFEIVGKQLEVIRDVGHWQYIKWKCYYHPIVCTTMFESWNNTSKEGLGRKQKHIPRKIKIT
jgi:hypothetical protein